MTRGKGSSVIYKLPDKEKFSCSQLISEGDFIRLTPSEEAKRSILEIKAAKTGEVEKIFISGKIKAKKGDFLEIYSVTNWSGKETGKQVFNYSARKWYYDL